MQILRKMVNFNDNYKHTKTTKFLHDVCKFVHTLGLPNFWFQDLDLSKAFNNFDVINKIGNLGVCIMLFSEYCAYFTQNNLSESQQSNLHMFSISNTLVASFFFRMASQRVEVKEIIHKLGLQLKSYNDREVEERMIKKSMFFSAALVLSCLSLVCMITLEAIWKVVFNGATYSTIITAWPDMDDRSPGADIIRAAFNVCWWIYLGRTFAVYTIVICLTVGIGHQYQNLNSYFCGLTRIFEKDSTQREKEEEYEHGFKVGVRLHVETLKCVKEIQRVCGYVYSGQIVFNIIVIIILMYQLVNSSRNLTMAVRAVATGLTILASTGFFMWNAGDITVEAEKLPTAMFSSGWDNCHRASSVRVRKLVVIAMMQAQRPVMLTGFGVIQLSYQSHVSIVKSSYSVFSMLY